tara:strand:- start:215 stop:574 length:360 start_codon:yes stop_codon:yes gene_type:complete
MSILSDLGEILGKKFSTLNKELQEKTTKLESLEQEISLLKTEIQLLKETAPTPTNRISDLRFLNKTKGVVFLTENLEEYRIRIDDNKKLVIDDVINGTNNIAEIQLYPSGSSPPNTPNE